ncbi:MAG: hypothetical protein LBC19_12540 [Tannerella sp.]|jgi:hypothetical protein|nr:hypothetical protein [Tannerella sp.]
MRTNCFIYLLLLLFAVTGCRDEVENISREAFPDLLFEQYMLQNFDTDADGLISLREAKSVRNIDCSDRRITSLKGIQYFTALETLNCSRNPINALDLTQNTALVLLTCDGCEFESIDLSKNTALNCLNCSENYYLKSLNLSNNTNLLVLYCNDNQNLASLNLDGNTNLQVLSFNRNPTISSLNLSRNTNLRELQCIYNRHGVNLTLTGLTYRSLEKLILMYVKIGAIDTGVSPLKELHCEMDVLPASIDLSGCDKLEELSLKGEFSYESTNINLTGCTALNTIVISGSDKSFDASPCTSLRKLYYRYGDVDISKNTELEEVDVRNILGDITNLRKLKTLRFWMIKNVEMLDLSNQTMLENLDCAVLDIPMDLSRCKALRTLYIRDPYFDGAATVDLKNLPALEDVRADYLRPQLLLNIENCPALKIIACQRLATLNVSGCASLEEATFRCEALNIDNCPNIINLKCSDSPLKTLYLDTFTKLEQLSCVNCSLTALDLRKNKKVNVLMCYDNPNLKYIDITRGHSIPRNNIGYATFRYWDE